MMIQDYLNQDITLKTKTGVNEYNEPTFSTSTVRARLEPDAKKIMLLNGEVITTKGRVFLWNIPNLGDKVSWGTFVDLEIFEISGIVDLGGKIVGYECLLK
jgi:hypothetical protein